MLSVCFSAIVSIKPLPSPPFASLLPSLLTPFPLPSPHPSPNPTPVRPESDNNNHQAPKPTTTSNRNILRLLQALLQQKFFLLRRPIPRLRHLHLCFRQNGRISDPHQIRSRGSNEKLPGGGI